MQYNSRERKDEKERFLYWKDKKVGLNREKKQMSR